ncbi:Modification methylase DpnIIA [bacterium HR36]|nr:Modification methylase DpnIIA [bacterium HR36]
MGEENLLAVSRALQNVEICCGPFERILERVRAQDWVYFDPPYVPVSPTANFTAYHVERFGIAEQTKLRDLCLQLSERNVLLMVSNSDTPLVRQLYGRWPFQIETVAARRAINCHSNKRGQVNELLITNYGQ